MTEAKRLHAEAERYRRLAQQSQASDARETFIQIAGEFLERARALERSLAWGQQAQLEAKKE
jgi:molecular chaperone GrpE (heat shock protein)